MSDLTYLNVRRDRGFTLPEVLIALAVITIISLAVFGALAPWLSFKAGLDNERKLQQVGTGFQAYYSSNAMAVERQPTGNFGPFVTSTVSAQNTCAPQLAAFRSFSAWLGEGGDTIVNDGYKNPFCILVSPNLTFTHEGVTLNYRNVAIVSAGPDGIFESASTRFDAQGNLTLGGDDVGLVASGQLIQREKLELTLARMNRLASIYETYFTSRFLASRDRDIARYYFAKGPSTAFDNLGQVESTGGEWKTAAELLADLGASPADTVSAWELDSNIEVSNLGTGAEGTPIQGRIARTPASTGTANLPYTAILRARLPGPASSSTYAIRAAVGNY